MKFESKYPVGALVEYCQRKDAQKNSFGFVVAVKFHKYDAMNFAASYDIEQVNTGNYENSLPEKQIVKEYQLK